MRFITAKEFKAERAGGDKVDDADAVQEPRCTRSFDAYEGHVPTPDGTPSAQFI